MKVRGDFDTWELHKLSQFSFTATSTRPEVRNSQVAESNIGTVTVMQDRPFEGRRLPGRESPFLLHPVFQQLALAIVLEYSNRRSLTRPTVNFLQLDRRRRQYVRSGARRFDSSPTHHVTICVNASVRYRGGQVVQLRALL